MGRPTEKPLENLDEVLKRLYLTTNTNNPRQFAKAIGKDPSAINKALKVRRIPQNWFDIVCEEFNSTESYLRFGEQKTKIESNPEVAKRVTQNNDEHRQAGNELKARIQRLHDNLDLIIDEGDAETQDRVLEDVKKSGDKIRNKKLSMKEKLLKRIIGE